MLSCVADMTIGGKISRASSGAPPIISDGLDILVNNAGDAAVGRTIEDPDEVWEQTYSINLWSAVRAARAAVPLMRERE